MAKNKTQKPVLLLLSLLISLFLILPNRGTAQVENSNQNQNLNSNSSLSTVSDPNNLSVDELNRSIQEKQDQKRLLEQKLQEYQDIIAEKQKTSASLKNELTLLDAQISKTELDIQALNFTVEEKQLQINLTQKAIGDKEKEIDKLRGFLGELVKTIYRYDQKDQLEILIAHNSFSDVVNDIRAASALQNTISDSLSDIRLAKSNLEREKTERERQKAELVTLQSELETTSKSLGDQKTYKSKILSDTQSNEQLYNQLLEQSRQEQLNADADIRSLQDTLKSKLGGKETTSQAQENIFTGNRNVQLSWPVSPAKGISAYFHDPTYPYRRYFEHPAIDIPTNQGTAIAAADDGYVARAKNAGFGYSYIMLVHSNSIATVYGHVSQINVAEETYVKKGQIIGLSGGLPGTPGAGNLTTGAHLHFEVRLNGFPVNPLDYLP
ncbi:hypothetical protein C4546_02765 [Candidatus Parcubacteria bacterium]|jgi:murein DD-endopeptidase MepM/ murein hydrolase activator NlpD|nr:MAG: hypothetical protein C4546_02765 [Candidatus Parcubacteria bacterium]